MLDIFRGLKNLIKINHVHIDSPVFRLHYSITVMILMSFSLIVTTRQYVGNPIDCVHTKDLPEDVLNTYCWIHSTFSIKSLFNKKLGSEVPYYGVGNSKSGNSDAKPDDMKFHKYYQWVCFCLFFQVSNLYKYQINKAKQNKANIHNDPFLIYIYNNITLLLAPFTTAHTYSKC